ncbi:hypothetical protein [Clostridium estertheticum]|uniref:hypothetical protein n=1 Tax=Clostridium estertheticum TaxID=238834 RepID=UPI001C7DAC37|nr:hypothetical protein [Clostridium estertheticum]MBX4266835.1 hypothetical protein [Clostridium estertheticum]WLC89020.1 hypothetical protein KTC95_01945 [Clostridium estertheticum]
MSIKNELTPLLINNANCFFNISDFTGIFKYKDEIDENITNDKINVLTIIWNGKDNTSNINLVQKLELYKWFNSLAIVSIVVVDNFCNGDLLELIMMCDIRLGGNNLSIGFPENKDDFNFNFGERCQLLMGKKRNIEGYNCLLKTTMSSNELFKLRFINKIIDMEDILNEIQNYINKLMINNNSYQIKAIKKCFNVFKQLGMNADSELLLEEESKQLCDLISKESLNKEVIR